MSRTGLAAVHKSTLAGVALALAIFALLALPAYTFAMVAWVNVPATDVVIYTLPLEVLALMATVRLIRLRRRNRSKGGST